MNQEIQSDHIKNINQILNAKNINEFWEGAEKIFDSMRTWEHVTHVKEEGSKNFALNLFNVFETAGEQHAKSKKEADGLRAFGKAMRECVEGNNLKAIAKELLRMTLQHFMELHEIKKVKDPQDLNIEKDVMSNLSQEMFMPYTVFNSLVMCKVFENLENLSAGEQEKFYALAVGLWQELQDLIITETVLQVKNTKRKKQIKDFIDNEHDKVINKYYDLMESELSSDDIKTEMMELISKDPYFFDPYLMVADIYIEEDEYHKAEELLKNGFTRAMRIITDCKGRWPKLMAWHCLENRHLIRLIDRYARELWEDGREAYAIELYRKLLKSNPGDNIGARYNILAINMGYEFEEVEDMFPASSPGFVDAIKMDNWFQENAIDFPEEFEWWFNWEKKNQ